MILDFISENKHEDVKIFDDLEFKCWNVVLCFTIVEFALGFFYKVVLKSFSALNKITIKLILLLSAKLMRWQNESPSGFSLSFWTVKIFIIAGYFIFSGFFFNFQRLCLKKFIKYSNCISASISSAWLLKKLCQHKLHVYFKYNIEFSEVWLPVSLQNFSNKFMF